MSRLGLELVLRRLCCSCVAVRVATETQVLGPGQARHPLDELELLAFSTFYKTQILSLNQDYSQVHQPNPTNLAHPTQPS